MATNFGALTVETIARPSRDVGAERWPDKLVSNHLSSPFDAGVTEAMYGVENLAAP